MAELSFIQFRGINNVLPDTSLSPSDFVTARNVDLDDAGLIYRRKGPRNVLAGPAHSIFSAGSLCLVRRGDALERVFPDMTTKVLMTGLTGARTVYQATPGRIYFADGAFFGWTDGEVARQVGMPPAPAPLLTSIGAGSLPAGRYLAAMTFLRADGYESGTRAVGIEAMGGIRFTALPVSTLPGVTQKALYLTRPGGKTLHRVATVSNDVTTLEYSGQATRMGARLTTLDMLPMPTPSSMTLWGSRLLCAQGNFLWFSEPYQHELRKFSSFIAFPEPITIVAARRGGCLVGMSSSIDILAGDDITSSTRLDAVPYGALGGIPAEVEASALGLSEGAGKVSLIHTRRGFAAFGDSASFTNLTEGRYWPAGSTAWSCIRQVNNQFRQLITFTR